jgi:hypothetical protein
VAVHVTTATIAHQESADAPNSQYDQISLDESRNGHESHQSARYTLEFDADRTLNLVAG